MILTTTDGNEETTRSTLNTNGNCTTSTATGLIVGVAVGGVVTASSVMFLFVALGYTIRKCTKTDNWKVHKANDDNLIPISKNECYSTASTYDLYMDPN